jgi:uncharacterized protein
MPAWLRPWLLVFGWICAGIGAVGLVLPGLPGTVFLILAAWCFARSSPRFESWLLRHPRLGPPVRGWRETGAIPRPVKGFACASLAASWGLIYLADPSIYVRIGCAVLFIAVALFIVTRPDGAPPA